MSMPISSYTFVTSGGQRRFVHRWQYENNEVIECNKCGSSCKETDAYGQHWPQPKTLDTAEHETNMEGSSMAATGTKTPTATPPPPSPSSALSAGAKMSFGRITTLMDHKEIIVSKNIESFMLCDTKAVSDTQQFLLDAGIKAVPDLLSAAYAMCGHVRRLGVVLSFYVQIKEDTFRLQTTELTIGHHYDIRESVDMIFAMLLEKLRRYMVTWEPEKYSIKRMQVQIRRYHDKHLALPLLYARKQSPPQEMDINSNIIMSSSSNIINSKKQEDLLLLTSWFRQHLSNSQPLVATKAPFPCNLYCFQECQNSRELYVVPYHLNGRAAEIYATRSFVILCDIYGNFLELQEISNIRRFLHHSSEDRVVSCSRCQENFLEPSKLLLHKMLNCGGGFKMSKLDPDFIEIYEQCRLLEKCDNWSLFGIIE